jgi:hypothetical protein
VRFETLEDRNMPAIVIDVGHHFVKPDTTGQAVDIKVASSAASDPLVGGFTLKAQIGASSSGPVFDGLEFGSLWNTFPHTSSKSWQDNTAQGHVSFGDGLDAKANGSLVKLSVDTTGVHSGSYRLNLMATTVGNSSFVTGDGAAAESVIVNGVVQVLSSWQNHIAPTDVSQDGVTSAVDVLLVINAFNISGAGTLAPPSPGEPGSNVVQWSVNGPKIDVDGNGVLTALDILQVVNCINGDECISQPMAIAGSSLPADKPNPDSASVVPPPDDTTLPGDEPSEESGEEILDPDEEPVGDPPDNEPVPLIDDYDLTVYEDPSLTEYLNELFESENVGKLLS